MTNTKSVARFLSNNPSCLRSVPPSSCPDPPPRPGEGRRRPRRIRLDRRRRVIRRAGRARPSAHPRRAGGAGRHLRQQRVALSPDGTRIRANQGHSVDVELDLPQVAPPARLYHGTVAEFLRRSARPACARAHVITSTCPRSRDGDQGRRSPRQAADPGRAPRRWRPRSRVLPAPRRRVARPIRSRRVPRDSGAPDHRNSPRFGPRAARPDQAQQRCRCGSGYPLRRNDMARSSSPGLPPHRACGGQARSSATCRPMSRRRSRASGVDGHTWYDTRSSRCADPIAAVTGPP